MREIKFRGKALHNDEWLYGDLINIHGEYHILGEDDMREDGHHITQDSDRPTWVKPDTVGEFTGLKDCNGEEVYEGDVIRSYGSKGDEIIHIIEYYDEEACFITRLNGYSKDDFGCGPVRQSWINEFKKEVIGNIHDNFDLMK